MLSRILVIDDDPNIRDALKRGLSYEGFAVDVAKDGPEGLGMARQRAPDLVVLDLMMPGMDGLEVCRRLRSASQVPVLMLTARDAVSDRITGLQTGADDYLVKPFDFGELVARVKALLRRAHPEQGEVLRYADLELDTASRRAKRAGREIELTTREYALLELFMRSPGRVFSSEYIVGRVWGDDFAGESNVVEVYVRYLRKKLEGEGEARLIHTMRGSGYVLREA